MALIIEDKIPVLRMDLADNKDGSQAIGTEDGKFEGLNQPKKGLSFWLASFFIVGEMAGSGVLILPSALADAGWGGVALLIFCCVNALYAGICLGRCWSILEERYEEYRVKNRYPYPAIAYRAAGLKMRYFVSVCLEVNLLGVSIVFLLLSSELIATLAVKWGVSFCYWILIIAFILCPLMWLGTPEDFWPAAVLAVGCTVTACILLIVSIVKNAKDTGVVPVYAPPSVLSFFLSFGTIFFSFGGAASFPTFQNDMEDKSQFPKAAITGFVILLLLYLPVAVLGYSVYGDSLKADVIQSLPDSGLKTAITVLLAMHTMFAFLLVINASSQEFEEMLKIPKNFGWKRISVRSGILLFVLFVGLSVPRFGKVLNLVGGSAVTLTASVFPCLFYYLLCSQRNPNWPERFIPIHEKVYLIIIIACGVIGGIISTYSAFSDILDLKDFNPPCYVNQTAASRL